MKKLLAALFVLATTFPAFSQVRQSGSVTPRHFTCWTTSGVVQDCGSAANPVATSLGTVGAGPTICASSGPVTGAYNQLCLGANLGSAAQITLQSHNGAANQALQICTNGQCFTAPSSSTGSLITGTPPFSNTGMAAFSGTSGDIVDSGVKAAAGVITSGAWGGTTIPLTVGGTGGTSGATARTNLGLGTISTQDASAVTITGGTITGLPTPTAASDAAIKSYVDSAAAGLIVLPQSALVTAAVLPNTPTYSNGASGVGATLTAGSNTTLTVDGTVATLNTVVLVRNQASTFQNGIYTVTTAGGGVPWVLTRATYFDTNAEMLAGSYTYVTGGATLSNTAYTLQTTVATVGSSAVTFNLFNSASSAVTSIGGLNGAVGLGDGLTTSSTNVVVDRTTVRTKVAAPFTLYVRSDGSDSNTCTANSAGGACLTVQGALNLLMSKYDLGGYQATISIVNNASTPQTYTAVGAPIASLIGPLVGAPQRSAITVPTSAACPVIIKSASGTASDIVLTANTNTMFADAGAFFCVQDVTINSTGGASIRAGGSPSGGIDLGGTVILGASAAGKIFTSHGGNVEFYGSVSLTGASTCVLEAEYGGFIFAAGITFTQLADFTVSKAFACVSAGQVSSINNTFTSGGFTLTGPKFTLENSGKIITTTNDLTLLPGTTGGTMSSGTYDDYTGPLPCTLSASVAANALTVALLDSNGNTPTTTSPCSVVFRNGTTSSGLQNKQVITSATTFSTAGSGSTFAAANNQPFRLWFTLLNNSGTVQLGVSRQSDTTNVYPLLPGLFQSSTACNACGTATAAGTIYTTSALTTKPMTVLGYADWLNGLPSAGVWSINPVVTTNYGAQAPQLPGSIIQTFYVSDTTQVQASGVTKVPTSLTKTFTPKMGSSIIRVQAVGPINITTNLGQLLTSLSKDNCTNVIGSTALAYAGTAGNSSNASLMVVEQAGSLSASTTYVVCVWGSAAAANAYTWNYNGVGTATSVMIIEEIMG